MISRNEKSRPPKGNRRVPVEFGRKTKKCHLPKGQMTLCYEILCSASAKLRNLQGYYSRVLGRSQGIRYNPHLYHLNSNEAGTLLSYSS